MGNKKVVIVGAGCAGLSAAYTLKNAGIDFVVLEATDVYGGRCRSVDDREAGSRKNYPQKLILRLAGTL
jgi:monoamine oxidase